MEIIISIDIGGTATKVGLVNQEHGVLAKSEIPTTRHKSVPVFFTTLFDEIDGLLNQQKKCYELIGVGISAPSCNLKKGTFEGTANLTFLNDINIIQYFEEKYRLEVRLIKDGNAAALGEGLYGAAKGMKDYILLTLGTGFGCGIVVSGMVVQGANGLAGEFGHTIVRKNGRKCGCGAKGCLETYVSATGIKRSVYKLLADSKLDSSLRRVSFHDLSPKMIHTAALQGDIIALKAFDYTGKILGQKIGDLINIFEPEAIFLAGGLSAAGDMLLNPVIKNATSQVMPIYKSSINIQLSALAVNEAALLGAASLIWNQQKEFAL